MCVLRGAPVGPSWRTESGTPEMTFAWQFNNGAVLPIALTIAGSDPSGGAGIQADLKIFHQLGVYGEAATTLITVQNTLGVQRVEVLAPDLVEAQIAAVLSDIPPHAAKTGALGNVEVVRAVARMAAHFSFPLVVDPVMISKAGSPLLSVEAVGVLISELIPCAYLLTPNLPEAAALTNRPVETREQVRDAARRLADHGAKGILIKGGHGTGEESIDVLLHAGEFLEFPAARLHTRHTHGTGCTYSAAITGLLASGLELPHAVRQAKRFITEAIRTNPGLGSGAGPVNHWV
jgi:hydroxymethylpyrimidine/phosphomethylpyrimidine kinase